MAKVRSTLRVERAGVNAVRALLEEHDHLVNAIDGGVDHGEDMYVGLTRDRRRTGYVVAVQVKSGTKYRRVNGYAIPISDHFEDWRDSKIPIVGMVYDPEARRIAWTNLTAALEGLSTSPGWVQIPGDAILTSDSMQAFETDLEQYIDTSGRRIKPGEPDTMPERIRAAQRAGSSSRDGAGQPNEAFAPLADLLLRSPRIMRHGLQGLAWFTLLAGLVADWPYMLRFAREYAAWSPNLWVLNIYFFIVFLATIVTFERKAGRPASTTIRWLAYVMPSFLLLPFMMGSHRDAMWGGFWAGVGALVPNAAEIYAVVHFVGAEVDRRRAAS